jgi:hypothetical protein
VNKVLNEEVIEHEKEHCEKKKWSEKGREKERERWVKEMQQLMIERTYPTMKMVLVERLKLRISLFFVEEDSSLSKLQRTFKYFFPKVEERT